MLHQSVLFLSVGLMLAVATAFVAVAVSGSTGPAEFEPVVRKSYRWRAVFFAVTLVAGLGINLATTRSLPYAEANGAGAADAVEVDVEGRQWYWELSQAEATVGDTVVFNVSSADVNHGFGIYDENLRMLAQTQAMPGYVNSLGHTFDRPGTYRLMCLEYCGLAHHAMVSEFVVKPAN